MWKNFAKSLVSGIYIEPGVWNIPATSLVFHAVLGYCIWTGALSWQLGLLVFVYQHEIRLVYATKKARKLIMAQREAYQQAYNQEMIEQGRLIAPDGKEYQ